MSLGSPVYVLLVFLVSALALLLLVHLYLSLCLYAIARKAKARRLWRAWVPVTNLILMCELVEVPWWWALICLVPGPGVLPVAWLYVQLPKAIGITGLERFAMLVPSVNIVYLAYLAFIAKPGPPVAAFERPMQASR